MVVVVNRLAEVQIVDVAVDVAAGANLLVDVHRLVDVKRATIVVAPVAVATSPAVAVVPDGRDHVAILSECCAVDWVNAIASAPLAEDAVADVVPVAPVDVRRVAPADVEATQDARAADAT